MTSLLRLTGIVYISSFLLYIYPKFEPTVVKIKLFWTFYDTSFTVDFHTFNLGFESISTTSKGQCFMSDWTVESLNLRPINRFASKMVLEGLIATWMKSKLKKKQEHNLICDKLEQMKNLRYIEEKREQLAGFLKIY